MYILWTTCIIISALNIIHSVVISTFKPLRINSIQLSKPEFLIKINYKYYHLKLEEDEYSNHWTSISVNGVAHKPRQLGRGCNMVGFIRGYPDSSAYINICDGMMGEITFGNNTFVVSPKDINNNKDLNGEHVIKIDDNTENNMKYRIKEEISKFYKIKQDIRPAFKMKQSNINNGESLIIQVSLIIPHMTFISGGIWNGTVDGTMDTVRTIIYLTDMFFRKIGLMLFLSFLRIESTSDQGRFRNRNRDSSSLEMMNLVKEERLALKSNHTGHDITIVLSPYKHSGQISEGWEKPICDPAHDKVLWIWCTSYHFCSRNIALQISKWNILLRNQGVRFISCSCEPILCIQSLDQITTEYLNYSISDCEAENMHTYIRSKNGCLTSIPNKENIVRKLYCGNFKVEHPEQCDCGFPHECNSSGIMKCCNPLTCNFTNGSNCINGTCCDNCNISGNDTTCQITDNECVTGRCTGTNQTCVGHEPKPNGAKCMEGLGECNEGLCSPLIQACDSYFNTNTSKILLNQINSSSVPTRLKCSNSSMFLSIINGCDKDIYNCSTFSCNSTNSSKSEKNLTLIVINNMTLLNCSETIDNCLPHGIIVVLSRCENNESCWNETCTFHTMRSGGGLHDSDSSEFNTGNSQKRLKDIVIFAQFATPIISTIVLMYLMIELFLDKYAAKL